MINILPVSDNPNSHRWNYCYLDGEAEKVIDQYPPDIFEADVPMPDEGNHLVMIDGQPALAVIAEHRGTIGGRVALLSDSRALKHALTPEDWR